MIRSLTRLALATTIFFHHLPAGAAEPQVYVYKGAGCDGRDRIPRFEQVMGVKVIGAVDFLSQEGWPQMIGGAKWALDCWSQVLHARLGSKARIVAIDLLPMDPIHGVTFLQGDFRESDGLQALESALGGSKVDLVVSDLAPNLSGIESADQARAVLLGELALDFARQWLQPGGDLVVKAFQGSGFADFERATRSSFEKVYVRKPKASRDRSREVYLVAKRLAGSTREEK